VVIATCDQLNHREFHQKKPTKANLGAMDMLRIFVSENLILLVSGTLTMAIIILSIVGY
jgi:hypothetical protein